ncbi:hypothetical protein N9L28_05750 [Luminiphilus sp.]|nr:hypothetical protein [Luminiphilus sp.]
MERWLVDQKHKAEAFCKFVHKELEEGRPRFYTIVHANRTNRQNATVHLLFRRMATALNEAGFEISHPFKPELEIPWSEHSVKELLYRPIITSYFKVEQSSALDTTQISESMEILVDAVNRNTGVYVPIPSQEP